MKRTTVSLPDDLAAAVARERRSAARLGVAGHARGARRAPRRIRGQTEKRRLGFAKLGASGKRNTSRDVEKILDAEWGDLLAVVDAGTAFYAASPKDENGCQPRGLATRTLERRRLDLVIPALVVAEDDLFDRQPTRRRGQRPASRLGGARRALTSQDRRASKTRLRIAELVEHYADFPLGGTRCVRCRAR